MKVLLFAMITGLIVLNTLPALATMYDRTMEYSGYINRISEPGFSYGNPYAKVGDKLHIKVNFDSSNSIAPLVIVNLESWGDMYPSYCAVYNYFKAPDSWEYVNMCTKWTLSGDTFSLISDGFNGLCIYGRVAPVPEPATILLFGAGLGGLVFWQRKKMCIET